MFNRTQSGFSLVELSIVLVILGLLVGGVMSGQNLIRAAELRSISTDYEKYVAAIYAFRDKYFAIPGDMNNATRFWGTAASCGHQDILTDQKTCNGNGNRVLFAGKEGYLFWHHLANAGLIEGSYSGASGPDQTYWDVVPGVNTPLSKSDNAAWNALSLYYDNGGGNSPAIGGDIAGGGTWTYGINQLQLGRDSGTYFSTSPFLTPEELWNIDTKMDDGKPGTGIIIANKYSTCTDADDQFEAASGTANYDLQSNAIGCSIIFMPQGTGL